MQCPVPLKLTKITLRRFLIMYLQLLPHLIHNAAAHFDLPQPLRGEAEGQLVAAPLVFEAVYASEGLRDGDVEDEVSHGEEADGDPAVAALQPCGLGLG